MTVSDLSSLQELLELKLDALDTSLRTFEQEFRTQLERIEIQTTATNGRVTKLEMEEFTKQIIDNERQRHQTERQEYRERWGGWFKPVVTGVVMALIIAISNIDKL
jgi:predicted  nucleic acid-binding Zn-ribbon protein